MDNDFRCIQNHCIPMKRYRDGRPDCFDASDESIAYLHEVSCGSCEMKLFRLENIDACNNLSSCDRSTCYETVSLNCSIDEPLCTETEVICSSYCPESDLHNCFPAYQCDNGALLPAWQFCDGKVDCPDGTDELVSLPGFKCLQSRDTCILSFRNLNDNVSHCPDGSDLCRRDGTCFSCLYSQLYISSNQVCDNVVDCYDFSDECLCNSKINHPNCEAWYSFLGLSSNTCTFTEPIEVGEVRNLLDSSPSLLYVLGSESATINFSRSVEVAAMSDRFFCARKSSNVLAAVCDGRIDCRNFSDECNCENSPSFCNDTCYSFYPLGDQYRDGKEDPAWVFINDLACPKGFDERNCPKRYYCKAADRISISNSQVCDNVIDCDDKSDEADCSISLFSSQIEMIANPVLRLSFWVIGFVVVLGNLAVIVTTSKLIWSSSNMSGSLRWQHIIVLHVSIADLLMGVFLLIIASVSSAYSGSYGEVDQEWRSSLSCSVVGSLAIISSEASCFLVVTLTAFRLNNVLNPIRSISSSSLPWKIGITLSWLVAAILGIIPFVTHLQYFIHTISFPSVFGSRGIWNRADLSKFVCRYAAMTDKIVNKTEDRWQFNRMFLKATFQEGISFQEYGYYGETSVCMPRLYVEKGENAWEYTLAIITVNFLAFAFVVVGYFIIYSKSTQTAKLLRRSRRNSIHRELIMQKRIIRIIATDFCCWIPICFMAYLRLGGVFLSDLVYQISAVYLLPINSALNPFLFSSLPDKLLKKLSCK